MTACCSPRISTLRRGFVPLVVCSALCAAAFVRSDPAGTRPAIDAATLFPAGTVLVMSIDGGPCSEFGKELAVSRIWNEPEVQAFMKSTFELLQEMGESNVKEMSEQIGVSPADLEQLAKSKISLALTRFDMKGGGRSSRPELDLMLAADLRGRQKSFEPILKVLEKLAGDVGMETADATVGGIPSRTMTVPRGGPFQSVTYLFHEGWLLAGSSTSQLEAAITRAKSGDSAGSLAADAAYAQCAKEVMKPKTIFSLFVNLAPVWQMVDVAAPPEVKTMLAAAGLDGLRAEAIGMELDGASIRERVYVAMNPGSPLLKMVAPMDPSAVLARIPKRSIAAYATTLNLKEYFAYFQKLMGEIPDAREMMEQGLAEVDKFLGSTWKEDLLPNIGPEIAVFAALPQYGLVPDLGVLVKTGDRSKVEAAIARMLEQPKANAAHRTLKYGEATIHYLDMGTLEIDRNMNMRPAWVFADDYLLLAITPHTAKSLLNTMSKKDGGLFAKEDFSKAFGRLKAESPNAGNLGIGYLDAQWVIGVLLDTAIPIAQSSASPNDLEAAAPLKIDLGLLPSTEAITKHLGPILLQSQLKEGGSYADIVSPVGTLGITMALGAVGAYFSARDAREYSRIDAERMLEAETRRATEEGKDEDK